MGTGCLGRCWLDRILLCVLSKHEDGLSYIRAFREILNVGVNIFPCFSKTFKNSW